jgi:hypothetical protein
MYIPIRNQQGGGADISLFDEYEAGRPSIQDNERRDYERAVEFSSTIKIRFDPEAPPGCDGFIQDVVYFLRSAKY